MLRQHAVADKPAIRANVPVRSLDEHRVLQQEALVPISGLATIEDVTG